MCACAAQSLALVRSKFDPSMQIPGPGVVALNGGRNGGIEQYYYIINKCVNDGDCIL